jgi:hypothetical protein
MTTKIDAPTVRQAAEMMPAGPDREALHARAREFYDAGHGPFIEKRIAAVQRALEMIWSAQESQQTANPGQPPVNAREHLRYENQLDRLYRGHDALWEQAFKSAREAIFRESRKRLATPVYEVDEHWNDLKERLNHDGWYEMHRPGLEADFAAAAAAGAPKPAPVKTAPAPKAATITNTDIRQLGANLDRLMKEVDAGRPKPIGAA